MSFENEQRLDLQSVRIVRAIAETGSITGAARALGYSQPAISQHLQRTEARLGLALVARVGRSVRLTEAGTVLARHALTITSAFDAAEGDLADLAGLRTGTVRLAAFPTASSTIVPRLLAALAAGHPGITVTYIEAQPPEAVQLLRDGGVDLAITFSYPGDRADPHRGHPAIHRSSARVATSITSCDASGCPAGMTTAISSVNSGCVVRPLALSRCGSARSPG
jgi:molybdate transport repressor ModE-like protein